MGRREISLGWIWRRLVYSETVLVIKFDEVHPSIRLLSDHKRILSRTQVYVDCSVSHVQIDSNVHVHEFGLDGEEYGFPGQEWLGLHHARLCLGKEDGIPSCQQVPGTICGLKDTY